MSIMEQVLELANSEIGYLEKKTNSQLYDKTANAGSNNYTKYWAEVSPDLQGEAWCACFVTWTLLKIVGKEKAKQLLWHYPYISCQNISKLFTLNSNPKVGDIVIFYRNNRFAHTGWVVKVEGDKFYTIEGNTSGASGIVRNGGGVCKKSYYNSNLPGTKFITLDWGLVQEETVINSYGEITANSLNIRKNPTTNSAIIGKHIAGDSVFILTETDGWYKVNYPFGIGYIKAEYVRLTYQPVVEEDNFSNIAQQYKNYVAGLEPDSWSKEARDYAESAGYIQGDSRGYKKYKSELTREELVQILFNIFKRKV